jgi:adenylate cyclase
MSESEYFDYLSRMLTAYSSADSESARKEVEAQLWDKFGQRCAVFISDLSGFSRLTAKYSIVHFLSLIQLCCEQLVPIIRQHEGTLIKTTADNVYATFPDAGPALDASIAMQRHLKAFNEDRDPDFQIGLCIGVGYGDILVLGDRDFFGHQLNLAFKLGEDTAVWGEVLATTAAMERVDSTSYPHEDRLILLSGISIAHASVLWK